ncbi:MAG: hypothetical protein ABH829_01130 [archaeon]
MKAEELKKKLRKFEEEGTFGKGFHIARLVPNHIEKARHNLLVAKVLRLLDKSKNAQDILKLHDFKANDWVVVCSYYAMYHAALAAIGKLGFWSKNHAATSMALECYYVRKGLLEKKHLETLREAKKLEEEYVMKLRRARRERETAQYSAEVGIEREAADLLVKDANDFVDKIDALLTESGE